MKNKHLVCIETWNLQICYFKGPDFIRTTDIIIDPLIMQTNTIQRLITSIQKFNTDCAIWLQNVQLHTTTWHIFIFLLIIN